MSDVEEGCLLARTFNCETVIKQHYKSFNKMSADVTSKRDQRKRDRGTRGNERKHDRGTRQSVDRNESKNECEILKKNDNFIKIRDDVNKFHLYVKCGDFESYEQMQRCYYQNKEDFIKLAKFIQNLENLKEVAEKAGLDMNTIASFSVK